MKLGIWLKAKAIVEVVFGIGFVIVPKIIGSLFGMDLGPQGLLMSRLFGAAFIWGSVSLWQFSSGPDGDHPPQLAVMGLVATNLIGFLVTLIACFAGTWNALGWIPVLLYLGFGFVFAWSIFKG